MMLFCNRVALPFVCFSAFTAYLHADEPRYAVLNEEGAELLMRNKLAEAAVKLEQARTECGDCTELPAILNNLAVVARRKGAYGEAIALHREALSLRETKEGPAALSLLSTLNNLTVAYREAGQSLPALSNAQRAVNLAVMYHAEDTSPGADAYANLGNIMIDLGDMLQGRHLLERALASRRILFGASDAIVGETLNDLAVVYKQSGQLGAAADLTGRAIAIFSAAPERTAALLPIAENNLGRIFMDQRRWKEGERSFRLAIVHSEKQLGADDPLVAVGMTNLASLLGKRHQFAEAEKLTANALAIDRRAYSPRHARVAYDLSTEGLIAFERRDYALAESLLMDAANILTIAHPPTHPEIGRISADLGEVYLKQHRNAEAESAFAKASIAMEATFGSESPQLLAILLRYSVALRAEQKFAEAANVDAQAMRIQVKRTLHGNDSAGRSPRIRTIR